MKRLIMFALVVALMAAGPAYGQSASKDTYGGKGGVISNISGGGPPSSDPSSASPSSASHNSASVDPSTSSASSGSGKGSLPFTGFDVMLLAIGGAALVGVGMGVRRLSRPLA